MIIKGSTSILKLVLVIMKQVLQMRGNSDEIHFFYLQGELVALMNGARSPPSLHQEWSDYRYSSSFSTY